MTPLPTIEQAREARRLINRGRKAMGLPRRRYLDFDNADPGATENCLSARNVFWSAGYRVGAYYDMTAYVEPASTSTNPEVLAAMGMAGRRIPDSILNVTNAFDAQVEGLRERLVEAGVVKP